MASNANKLKSILGQEMREFLKEKKFTKEQLAIKSGISYNTLVKIENGVIKNPSFETVPLITKGLEVTLETFFPKV